MLNEAYPGGPESAGDGLRPKMTSLSKLIDLTSWLTRLTTNIAIFAVYFMDDTNFWVSISTISESYTSFSISLFLRSSTITYSMKVFQVPQNRSIVFTRLALSTRLYESISDRALRDGAYLLLGLIL